MRPQQPGTRAETESVPGRQSREGSRKKVPRTWARTLSLKALSAADSTALIAHFSRLNEFDRYRRFFSAVSQSGVDSFVRQLDWSRMVAVGAFDNQRLIGVAELGWPDLRSSSGELAISVDRGWRNRGLATWLVREVGRLGYRNGIARMEACWLSDNDSVGRIVRALQGNLRRDGTLWRGEIETATCARPITSPAVTHNRQ
jgi:GNAT superfamily N-acetyltransferase